MSHDDRREISSGNTRCGCVLFVIGGSDIARRGAVIIGRDRCRDQCTCCNVIDRKHKGCCNVIDREYKS